MIAHPRTIYITLHPLVGKPKTYAVSSTTFVLEFLLENSKDLLKPQDILNGTISVAATGSNLIQKNFLTPTQLLDTFESLGFTEISSLTLTGKLLGGASSARNSNNSTSSPTSISSPSTSSTSSTTNQLTSETSTTSTSASSATSPHDLPAAATAGLINPLEDEDAAHHVAQSIDPSTIAINDRKCPVAATLFPLLASNIPGSENVYRIPILGTIIPPGLFDSNYMENVYVPEGILSPSLMKDNDGKKFWGGDFGTIGVMPVNGVILRTNPYYKLPDNSEPVEPWLMEPSVEIQYRALLDTNNINLPTRNYSLPNSGNTQTSHGYLNQEGIDAYLPPSSSESFEKLWDYIMGNATLPSWESLGPTSNSKGANSYSMGLSVINCGPGIAAPGASISIPGSALAERAKLINALVLEVAVPYLLATKSERETRIIRNEWELRNPATIGDIHNKYFTSIQINIARLGKSIKISLGAFGVIHIDTGDHSHAGSVVMTLGSRSSPNTHSGGLLHLSSGTRTLCPGNSISHFDGRDPHLPLMPKVDPEEANIYHEPRVTIVVYTSDHGFSRDSSDPDKEKHYAITNGFFIGNQSSRQFKTFAKNSDTFFILPTDKSITQIRPTSPPVPPSAEAIAVNPLVLEEYQAALTAWRYLDFSNCSEVKKATFLSREAQLTSPNSPTSSSYDPCGATDTESFRERWKKLMLPDPFDENRKPTCLPMPTIFMDEPGAPRLLLEISHMKLLSASMTFPMPSSASSSSKKSISPAVIISLVDKRPTYCSENLMVLNPPNQAIPEYQQVESDSEPESDVEDQRGEQTMQDVILPLENRRSRQSELVGSGELLPQTNHASNQEKDVCDLGKEIEIDELDIDEQEEEVLAEKSFNHRRGGRKTVPALVVPKDSRMETAKKGFTSLAVINTADPIVATETSNNLSSSRSPLSLKPFDLTTIVKSHIDDLQSILSNLDKINHLSLTTKESRQDKIHQTQLLLSRRQDIISNHLSTKSDNVSSSSLLDVLSIAILTGGRMESHLSDKVVDSILNMLDLRLIGISYLDLQYIASFTIPALVELALEFYESDCSTELPPSFIEIIEMIRVQICSTSKVPSIISASLVERLFSELPTLNTSSSPPPKSRKRSKSKLNTSLPHSQAFSIPPVENRTIPLSAKKRASNSIHFTGILKVVLLNLFVLPAFSTLDSIGNLLTLSNTKRPTATKPIKMQREQAILQLTQRASIASYFQGLGESYYLFSLPQIAKAIHSPHAFLIGSSVGANLSRETFDLLSSHFRQSSTGEVKSAVATSKELHDCLLLYLIPIPSTKDCPLSDGPAFSRLPSSYQKDNYTPGFLFLVFFNECIAILTNSPPINKVLNHFIRTAPDKLFPFRWDAPTLDSVYANTPIRHAYSQAAIYNAFIRRTISFGFTTSSFSSIIRPNNASHNKLFNDCYSPFYSPKSFREVVLLAIHDRIRIANQVAYSTATHLYVENAAVAAVILPGFLGKLSKRYGIEFGDNLDFKRRRKISWTTGVKELKESGLPLVSGDLLGALFASDLSGLDSFIAQPSVYERSEALARGGKKGLNYLDHEELFGPTDVDYTRQASYLFVKGFQFFVQFLEPEVVAILRFDANCFENTNCKVGRAALANALLDLQPIDPDRTLVSISDLLLFKDFIPTFPSPPPATRTGKSFNSTTTATTSTSTTISPDSHSSTSASPSTSCSNAILLPSTTTQTRNSSFHSIPSTSKINSPTPAAAYTPRNSLINSLLKFQEDRVAKGYAQGWKFDEANFEAVVGCDSWEEVEKMEVGDEKFEEYFAGSLTEVGPDGFSPWKHQKEKKERRLEREARGEILPKKLKKSRGSNGKASNKISSSGIRSKKGKEKEEEDSEDDVQVRRSSRLAEDSTKLMMDNPNINYGVVPGSREAELRDEDSSSDEDDGEDEDREV